MGSLDCSPSTSAGEACAALCAKAGLVDADLRLVFEGKQLDADASLAESGVEAGCTLHMLPRLVGGVIEPSLVVLAKKYNQEKKVCRICSAPRLAWWMRRCASSLRASSSTPRRRSLRAASRPAA